MNDEDTLLRELVALVRPATVLERQSPPAVPTWELAHGGGGSHLGGVPYLEADESWPRCAHGAMRCALQIDCRDARHETELHGLYVIYECAARLGERFEAFQAGRACEVQIRFYASPSRERRAAPTTQDDRDAAVLVPGRMIEVIPADPLIEQVVEERLGLGALARLDALTMAEPWRRVYWRLSYGRFRGLLYDDHLGGWHATNPDRQVVPPRCATCGGRLDVVVQLEWGDGNKTLWACPVHPTAAHYAIHK